MKFKRNKCHEKHKNCIYLLKGKCDCIGDCIHVRPTQTTGYSDIYTKKAVK